MIRTPVSNIETIEIEYIKQIKKYFNYKIKNKDKLEKVFKNKRNLEYKMLRYFHENIEKIALAKPSEIKKYIWTSLMI